MAGVQGTYDNYLPGPEKPLLTGPVQGHCLRRGAECVVIDGNRSTHRSDCSRSERNVIGTCTAWYHYVVAAASAPNFEGSGDGPAGDRQIVAATVLQPEAQWRAGGADGLGGKSEAGDR